MNTPLDSIDPSLILPTGDRTLVQPDKAAAITDAGIHVPNADKKKTNIGTVVAVGPQSPHAVGDRLIFGIYAGTALAFGKRECLLLKREEILATLPSPSPHSSERFTHTIPPAYKGT